jgi:hypothetical protein
LNVKTRTCLLLVLLGTVSLPGGLGAQEQGLPEIGNPEEELGSPESVEPATVLSSGMQRHLRELIRSDAGITGPLEPASDKKAPENGEMPDATLELEPMVVEGERVKPMPPPLRETRVQKVLRTGTVWERTGSRFTQRFWMKGDRGVMFTVSW